jgi:hypothetical protein
MTAHICRRCTKTGRTVSEHTAHHRAHPSRLLAFLGAAVEIVAGAFLVGGGLGGGAW